MITDGWSSVFKPPYEPGSGAPPADAVSCERGARRKPAPFPGFVEPCHPTLLEEAPSGERWVHEIKFDGYRTQAHPKKDVGQAQDRPV
jgi:ATP-dependent DNA ligase